VLWPDWDQAVTGIASRPFVAVTMGGRPRQLTGMDTIPVSLTRIAGLRAVLFRARRRQRCRR
jgi:hypothetical protein